MKKRLLSILLALCMVLTLLLGTAWAAETSGTCGDNVTWSYSNGTLTIQGTGSMDDSAATPTRPWNDYCEQIHTVRIGIGVTRIGNYAFSQCFSLTDVTIPNSVTSIGMFAFADCKSLTNVTIPNSVISIEDGVFAGCDSLISATIPDKVSTIDKEYI